MLVLAIYNLKGNEALLARELAAVLGRTVYEASSRVRAPGGGPSVIGRFNERGAAEGVASRLRDRGFDTVLLDEGEIEADERRWVVRGFALADEELTVEAAGARHAVRYRDVELLLRGVKIVRPEPAAPRTTRKLSLVRAALSGGLVVTKTVQAPRQLLDEEREGFLHLYAPGMRPLAWRETTLHYRSLGTALLPSRHANFAQVVAELRRRCPRAIYDERLVTRAGQAQLLGPTLAADDHLDVAISVLAAALRRPPG